ncbi:unnamed protein product [Schistocephalus solidus]|uniref:Ovule protein n=1 Tax=Schistocephalus solidus TaxID=70667 RepID=A0A183TM93_SCHSO|nr:unnamed protein product [Schistocephalus solidus]
MRLSFFKSHPLPLTAPFSPRFPPPPPATNSPDSGPKVLVAPISTMRRSSRYTSAQSAGHLDFSSQSQSACSEQDLNHVGDELVDFKLGRRKTESTSDLSERSEVFEAGNAPFQKQSDFCFSVPLQTNQVASSRAKHQLTGSKDEDEKGCEDLNSHFSRLYTIIFSRIPGKSA